MRFSEWSLDQLIEYLQLAKSGMDYECVTRCYGEIHIYNGERKDGNPELTIDELTDKKLDTHEKICKVCPYKREIHLSGNSTKQVYCEYPDKDYIRQFFKKHGISKMEGFLGFINSKGDFPIKKSPKWCPLKQKEGADNG